VGWSLLAAIPLALAAFACSGHGPGRPPGATATDTLAAATPEVTTPALPRETPTAIPTATPTATFAGPEQYDGVDVRELALGPPALIGPETVVYYSTGCYACEIDDHTLFRAYLGPDGALQEDDLQTFRSRYPGTVVRVAANFAGGDIVVAICEEPFCGRVSSRADAGDLLLRSQDGGITWHEWGRLPPGSLLLGMEQERVLVATASDRTGAPRYWFYPGGQDVTPPRQSAGLQPWLVDSCGIVWRDERGTHLQADGATLLGPLFSDARPGRIAVRDPRTGCAETYIQWFDTRAPGSLEPNYTYLGFMDGAGRLPRAWAWHGSDFRVRGMLAPGVLFGQAAVSEPVAKRAAATGPLGLAPVLVNLSANTVSPLLVLTEALPVGITAYVDGIVARPYAKVTGTGDCLRIRDEPSLNSAAVACFADGVLLERREGPEIAAFGVTWRAVRGPGGVAGWVSAQYLDR
jgi:hypothetical protein